MTNRPANARQRRKAEHNVVRLSGGVGGRVSRKPYLGGDRNFFFSLFLVQLKKLTAFEPMECSAVRSHQFGPRHSFRGFGGRDFCLVPPGPGINLSWRIERSPL